MAQDMGYGGFWARMVALVLDSAVVLMILFAVGMALVMLGIALPEIAVYSIGMAVQLLYWPVLESSRWQATVGKRVMGLQVTTADGAPLGFLRACLRTLAKIVSAIPLGIGFLVAAFHPRKQALHDLIVKSLVPRVGPSQLWKVVLALVVGMLLIAATIAGLMYYVVGPMLKKGFESAVGDAMKGAPRAQAVPAPRSAAPAPAPRPAAAPTRSPAPAAAPAGKPGPDPEFDAIYGQPLTGLEKPNTTRAGPAILELSTGFPSSTWVKVHLPLPTIPDPALLPAPVVDVSRVLDAAGTDYYDPENTFEKGDVFRRAQMSGANNPPRLEGTRNVHHRSGMREAQKIEGQLKLRAPVDTMTLAFTAADAGKPKSAHDSVASLVGISGSTATYRFRGASENLLQVRGYGADGKQLGFDSRQVPQANRDVDQDLTITFKAPPSRIEVLVAARVIERWFPFSLARGAAAGAPSTATAGSTLAPRARATPPSAPTTAGAAPAPVPAPAHTPVPAASKPMAAPAAAAPALAPKPEAKKPAPKPVPVARPAPAPRAEPKPKPAAAPAALPAPRLPCVYKPVMTDEEIDACR